MIIDGKKIAEDIYTDLAPKFAALGRKVRLGLVVVGENPVIESFVRVKTRSAERLNVEMVRVNLAETASIEEIVGALKDLANRTDAVIAQLPLPKGIDVDKVLSAVPKEKDVDALNPTVPEVERPVHAPVALAVVGILKRSGVAIKGKRTVVV